MEKSGDKYFYDFRNEWGFHKTCNCKARESQSNDTCFRGKEVGHRANFLPKIKKLKPSPSESYDGNEKKITSFEDRGH